MDTNYNIIGKTKTCICSLRRRIMTPDLLLSVATDKNLKSDSARAIIAERIDCTTGLIAV